MSCTVLLVLALGEVVVVGPSEESGINDVETSRAVVDSLFSDVWIVDCA